MKDSTKLERWVAVFKNGHEFKLNEVSRLDEHGKDWRFYNGDDLVSVVDKDNLSFLGRLREEDK